MPLLFAHALSADRPNACSVSPVRLSHCALPAVSLTHKRGYFPQLLHCSYENREKGSRSEVTLIGLHFNLQRHSAATSVPDLEPSINTETILKYSLDRPLLHYAPITSNIIALRKSVLSLPESYGQRHSCQDVSSRIFHQYSVCTPHLPNNTGILGHPLKR